MPRTLLSVSFLLAAGACAGSPFDGTWAFELPDKRPAWLEVNGGEGSMLWSVGNPKPVRDLRVEGDTLHFVWKRKWRPGGSEDDVRVLVGEFTGRVVGDGRLELRGEHGSQRVPEDRVELILLGKRMPPMPPRPDLGKVVFGEPLELFTGRDLSGWKLSDPKQKNGWRAEGGILINETPKTDFGAHGEFGNLVTERLFGDFRLTVEYNVPEGGNSGVYLRGMYEAQVVDRDSSMQGRSGPGAIFGRITPSGNAGKPGGEWNRYVLTLVDRHVTVELNGEVVIDNRPLAGCTGGGLSADDTAPGPIFLQGDHTSVKYRNIVLEPAVKPEGIPIEFQGLWHRRRDLDGDGEMDIDLYLLLSETEVATLGPDGKVHWPDTTGWVDGKGELRVRAEEGDEGIGILRRKQGALLMLTEDDPAELVFEHATLSKAAAISLLSARFETDPDAYLNNIPKPRRSVVLPPPTR